MNEDMSQFLGVFLDEAREQMQLLEEDILKLEQSPSPALLQEIFRAAHTLKGSSRTMGFVPMGELTHAMEDVFDQLRQDKLPVSSALIDALFAALDALKAMMEDIADGGNTTHDTSVETASLRAVLEAGQAAGAGALSAAPNPAQASKLNAEAGEKKGATSAKEDVALSAPTSFLSSQGHNLTGFELRLSEAAFEAAASARSAGGAVYGLKLEVAADCIMKSVRALMTLQALDRIGTTLATLPDEDGLENESFDTTFEVVVASEAGRNEIVAAVQGVNEIRCLHITPWEAAPAQTVSAEGGAPSSVTTEPAGAAGGGQNNTASGHSGSAPSGHTQPAPAGGANTGADPANANAANAARAGAESVGGSPKSEAAKPKPQSATVRVDVARLDKLLDLVGELVIDRTRIARIGLKFEQQYAGNALLESLNETSVHIGRITDQLQDEIMKARMLPLDSVFSRFPRMIRDLAQKLGKEVQFEVEGQETELDRSVIEVIGDPLIHMLRNSIDHGIEMPDEREQAGKPRGGTVHLRARHQENSIIIEIEDDGRGIDPDKLKQSAVKKGVISEEAAQRLTRKEAIALIFAPGFSTAAALTDVSGRGVGMDIVRSNLQRLGALIDIDSRVGHGTTFRVQLPLTLAIIRGLLVDVAGCVYALPLNAVTETLKIEADTIHVINHREVILQRGKTLPLVRLRDVFGVRAGLADKVAELEQADYAVVGSRAGQDAASDAPLPHSAPESSLSESSLSENAFAESSSSGSSLSENALSFSSAPAAPPASLYVVVAGMAEKQVGFVVDALVGEQEVVIKTLGAFIGEIRGIAGATILGDGRVALIADINGLTAIAAGEKGKAHAA